jgi:3-hydroxyacyl-CoA dehydrogenase
MSKRAEDDVNLEELTQEELVAVIRSERKAFRRKMKNKRRKMHELRVAHFVAIEQRESALADLDEADSVIMAIVEESVAKAQLSLASN